MTATQLGTAHGDAGKILELPGCSLVVLGGEQRGREHVIEGERFRIGKSEDNDLVLEHSTVSRNHCEIVRDPRGFLVRDLGSTNGTLADGVVVKEAYLEPGTVLSVGKVELKVRPFAARIELAPSEAEAFGRVVGRSRRMREIFGLVERIAGSDATLLLGGETGTGKDLLAQSVHEASPRAKRPFIVVDCGAVVGSLIESELFGHEKGAFTGASSRHRGAFELAEGGTLFLDEIGELPLDLQPKLLRALEQRTFRRVGGSAEVKVDIRVIAATKRNLKMEVERGKFREDLYFRLAVVPIEMPPLRERREDVSLLVERLLEDLSRRDPDLPALEVESGVLASLAGHDWPGNVRELRNVLERGAYLSRAMGQTLIGATEVPVASAPPPPATGEATASFDESLSYRETKALFEERFERRYVAWLLERHGGNISAAARAAGMDRKYLHKLARKHDLHRGSS